MITVYNKEYHWEEGMTVESLLSMLRDCGSIPDRKNEYTTVMINNQAIGFSEFASHPVNDGDKIEIFPLMAGG